MLDADKNLGTGCMAALEAEKYLEDLEAAAEEQKGNL